MKSNFLIELFRFFQANSGKILEQTLVHTGITFLSLLLSILVALPLGIILSRNPRWASWVIGFTAIMQTIPSIALLGLMIPVLGIGLKPAIFALFIYALLPILRNTFTGINQVDPSIKESALAMGMTPFQILWKVELPLAMPVIMAGIRTATVINVGVATLAAYIGAGGLGEFIFGGISLNNPVMMVGGAAPAALLAVLLDFLLSKLERFNLRNYRNWISFLFLFILLGSFYLIPQSSKTKLFAGLTPEFFGRKDGYQGLLSVYKLKVSHVIISDAIMYTAIRDGFLDIISGYSTDGRIRAFHLINLLDDKHIFPPYQAAPLIRESTLSEHPELEKVLNLLSGKINDSIMTDLNYQVDYLKMDPEQVALNFLKKEGLFREKQKSIQGRIIIGTKIFSEQYILSAIYASLIRGYTHLEVITKTGLGGTQVCFGALLNHQIDLYPEYSGTGLLVILKPELGEKDTWIQNPEKVYDYVQKEFENRWNIKWLKPIGFNNAYSLIMRRDQAQRERIQSISDLSIYLKN